MSDKKRESMASKIDEVARNQIWREQLKTEYVMESALTPFQLNPKTCACTCACSECMCFMRIQPCTDLTDLLVQCVVSAITQKPTRTQPADFAKLHEDNETKALGMHSRHSISRVLGLRVANQTLCVAQPPR